MTVQLNSAAEATVVPPAILASPTSTETPAVASPAIIFGRDEAGRAHASVFGEHEDAVVEAAAQRMGMHCVVAASDDLRALAASLPPGRLFASGSAFVPFVKGALYDEILAAAGFTDVPQPTRPPASPLPQKAEGGATTSDNAGGGTSAAGGAGGSSGAMPQRPTTWAGIDKGSHVLACQGPMEGWYEAIVLYAKAADLFQLQWRDWPDEPQFTRPRKDLGLLPLNSRAGLA